MIKFFKTWLTVGIVLGVNVCFAHAHIECLDKGLAGELDGVIETSDMVSFIKGVFETVERCYLDVV